MNIKYKILLVDDSVEWLKSHINMINQLFQGDLFEIETALSGQKAFSKVLENKDNPYDLVITDLEMELVFDEENAGSWLVKNLISRDEVKNTKFLIISGCYNIEDTAEKFRVACIPKDMLINNPMLLKYKIMDLLGLETA